MKFYSILQLTTSRYVVLDEHFRRLDSTGQEPVTSARKERITMTLGQTVIFIRKHRGSYTTFLKFNVPQLNRVLNEHDIVRRINRNVPNKS